MIYELIIGKEQTKECDFVGVRRNKHIYEQVCNWLPSGSDWGTANLMEMRDYYHKYVVCRGPLATGNINGIEIVKIADFLLRNE